MWQMIIKALGLVKDFSNAQECYGKRWFTSKVLWANFLAVLALILQRYMNMNLSTEEQVSILAVINIVLRFFTVQPVVGKEDSIVCKEIPKEDVPPHTVIEEVEKGYTLHDKVIRHARVIVSSEEPGGEEPVHPHNASDGTQTN